MFRVAGTICHSLDLPSVFHQNRVRFQGDIPAVATPATWSNVGLDSSKNEIPSVKVRYAANFYMVGINVDTTICDAGSGVSHH